MTRGDDGFTMIELLVSTTIMLVIGGAISAALITGVRTTKDASDRLAYSTDAQLMADYFANDVQSSDDVSISDSFCGNVIPIVRFKWLDPVTTPSQINYASYAIETDSAGTKLVRLRCITTPAITNKVTVARFLASPPAKPSCAPDPCRPSSVSLTLTDGPATDGPRVNPYEFTVSGSRRVT